MLDRANGLIRALEGEHFGPAAVANSRRSLLADCRASLKQLAYEARLLGAPLKKPAPKALGLADYPEYFQALAFVPMAYGEAGASLPVVVALEWMEGEAPERPGPYEPGAAGLSPGFALEAVYALGEAVAADRAADMAAHGVRIVVHEGRYYRLGTALNMGDAMEHALEVEVAEAEGADLAQAVDWLDMPSPKERRRMARAGA